MHRPDCHTCGTTLQNTQTRFPHMPYHSCTQMRENYCCPRTEEELGSLCSGGPITGKTFTSDCLMVHQAPLDILHRWTPLCLLQHSLHMIVVRWHGCDKQCLELDQLLCHILLIKNMVRAFPAACLSLIIKKDILLSFSVRTYGDGYCILWQCWCD